MIDTIRASVQIHIDWFDVLDGWTLKSEKTVDCMQKAVFLKNGATVFMNYYNTGTLTISFSAAKVQNGSNAIAYDFSKADIVENTLAEVLIDELYLDYYSLNFKICRLDLNRDFVYESDVKSNAVMNFVNKVLPSRAQKRFDYETGLTSQTRKGNGFRVYRKDKDTRLKKSEQKNIKPTVRVEFQIDRKKCEKLFGHRPSLHETLNNRNFQVEKVWNTLISQSGISGRIITYSDLMRIARLYLSNAEHKTLQQMNTEPCFNDKKQRQKQLAVIRKLKKVGICPYSCEEPITLTIDIFKLIMNSTKKDDDKCIISVYQFALIIEPVSEQIYHRWYLDSS